MFKPCVLLLIVTVIVCECRHGCKHGRHQHRQSLRHYEREFHELASNVISADRQSEALCDPGSSVVEFLGIDAYSLQYSVGNYSVGDVTVKIRHRVLYVSARKPTTTFRDVRILPRVVDFKTGQWYIDGSKLYVVFAYKVPFKTDTPWTCDASVDDRVRDLPNFSSTLSSRFMDLGANSSLLSDDNVV